MSGPDLERNMLQAAVAIGCLSPLGFGLLGMVEGPAMLAGVEPGDVAPDLVSHYRYLSGIFFGLGLVLASCIRRIEARGRRFRWAAAAVITGGLARLGGLIAGDGPSLAHQLALVAELGLVPALLVWQARIARRCAGSS